ncbi:MAG: FitA-like ribbon-helix-helix domain-containing protein [Parvularculaceae bacterium]
MNKHVQIRELPEAVHSKLKIRAAEEGLSMSDYVKRLIERDLRRPRWDEIMARTAKMRPIALPETTAEMIRRERDAR